MLLSILYAGELARIARLLMVLVGDGWDGVRMTSRAPYHRKTSCHQSGNKRGSRECASGVPFWACADGLFGHHQPVGNPDLQGAWPTDA